MVDVVYNLRGWIKLSKEAIEERKYIKDIKNTISQGKKPKAKDNKLKYLTVWQAKSDSLAEKGSYKLPFKKTDRMNMK